MIDMSNIILPRNKALDNLKNIQEALKIPRWSDIEANNTLARQILARSKELYYSYRPYLKRGTQDPSWQWDFLAAINDYKGRIAIGGNRSGKTREGAYECILAINNEHPFRTFPDNGKAWIIGRDFSMIQSVDRPLFEDFMPMGIRPPVTRSKWYAQDNMWLIVTEKGEWRVWFKSGDSSPDKFQSQDLDWIWFDEEPPSAIFIECEARLMDRKGIWWITATPIKGTAWLKTLLDRQDVYTCTGSVFDNPYIPEDEIVAFAATLSDDQRDVRIHGKYVLFGGRPVFNTRILTKMRDRAEKLMAPDMGEIIETNEEAA